jgi:lactoylglutathione lyase
VIKELRVSMTVSDFERALRLYRDQLGLEQVASWDEHGHGVVLAAGRATLELLDEEHAGYLDGIEVGARVSGPIRLAFELDDAAAAAGRMAEAGATIVKADVVTPWGDRNTRLADPDGNQLTLFELSGAG